MRHLTLIALFCLSSSVTWCQTIPISQIESDLSSTYSKLISFRIGADTIAWDSLKHQNEIFKDKLLHYTSTNPLTLTYKFNQLSNANGIYIVSSEDSLFRIYSWDTWTGGTMHDFNIIYQKSVESISAYDSISLIDAEHVSFYVRIHSLRFNDKTCYLAISNKIYSQTDFGESIKIFTVENNTLNDSIRLILTQTDYVNEIDLDYSISSFDEEMDERPFELIKYDQEHKTIHVPVFINGKISAKEDLYKFNGEYFEDLGIFEKKN